jgi:hypothetical protein
VSIRNRPLVGRPKARRVRALREACGKKAIGRRPVRAASISPRREPGGEIGLFPGFPLFFIIDGNDGFAKGTHESADFHMRWMGLVGLQVGQGIEG